VTPASGAIEPIPGAVNDVARQVVDAALTVHRELGPGLLEAIYESCLERELVLRGVEVERQLEVPVVYRGYEVGSPLRLDLLVGQCVVVEVKSVEELLPVHTAQVLTYLKLTGRRLGLLVNFNVHVIKRGIKRVAL
jgi:GxxExxY protein